MAFHGLPASLKQYPLKTLLQHQILTIGDFERGVAQQSLEVAFATCG